MIVYQNNWFRVVEDGSYFYVDEPSAQNGAAIVPLLSDQLVLLEMHRPAQQLEATLEIPRGYGEKSETALDCAIRELREETGYDVAPGKLERLGFIRPNTGLLTSRVAVFLAHLTVDTPGTARDSEATNVVKIPVRELKTKLSRGEIEDGFTLSALCLLTASDKLEV
jgi:ADP-ribose pyrophosphatase